MQGRAEAKIFAGSSVSDGVRDGISEHWPEVGSKAQPWYLQVTWLPSNQPQERGMPRWGQLSRMAKRELSCLRPRTMGMPRSRVVIIFVPVSWLLRRAGYQSL